MSSIQKSYEDKDIGKFYLIPTPIGNKDDITLRAINTLKEVDLIYCEDTRETEKLLNILNIKKSLKSCHKYSEEKNKNDIYNLLISGKNIGYASDRGTPLISDPGEVVSKYLIEKGIQVIALPGASALLPALNMSGIDNSKFLFYGFLNSKKKLRREELEKLFSNKYTIIFYEAPHRITECLEDIYDMFGNRKISICREISKVHEEIFHGTLQESIEYSKTIKGEIVLIVEGSKEEQQLENINLKIDELINSGMKNSEAIHEISIIYGISKNKLYNDYIDYRKSKEKLSK